MCGNILKRSGASEEMDDFDENMTDGQMTDYFTALEMGDNGNWNVATTEYSCMFCHYTIEEVSDTLEIFRSLIIVWHEKANEDGDIFSKFVFQYLSFVAHLKNNLFSDIGFDRGMIQSLKNDESIKKRYLSLVESNFEIFYAWQEVIEELKRKPLKNSSHDIDNPTVDGRWNDTDLRKVKNQKCSKRKGVILNHKDWGNMIEFWYGVRNNLFHGGKNPDLLRDSFLVLNAYITLRGLMEIELRI